MSVKYMKFRVGVWVCPVLITLASCATPYKHISGRFGYDDFRITEDTFEVSFAGNGYTTPIVIDRYVLRRAAEVTLANGFTHFRPISDRDDTTYGSVSMSSGSGNAYAYNGGRNATAQYSGSTVQSPVRLPSERMRIKCFKDPKPVEDGMIHAHDYLRYNFPLFRNAEAAP